MEWKYFEHDVAAGECLAKAEPDNCFYEFVPSFVQEYGYLPLECQRCWKPLIFWNYSRDNVARFKKMLVSSSASLDGKYNDGVVVFYTDAKDKLNRLLSLLSAGIREYEIDGRVQWRVSGRYWQEKYPNFFLSAKELSPAGVAGDKSMREWLRLKREAFKNDLVQLVGHSFDVDDDAQVWAVLKEFKLLGKVKSLSYGKSGLYRCSHPVAQVIALYRLTPDV